jgi:hypothetical protein
MVMTMKSLRTRIEGIDVSLSDEVMGVVAWLDIFPYGNV